MIGVINASFPWTWWIMFAILGIAVIVGALAVGYKVAIARYRQLRNLPPFARIAKADTQVQEIPDDLLKMEMRESIFKEISEYLWTILGWVFGVNVLSVIIVWII